jgi:hypothetical protein
LNIAPKPAVTVGYAERQGFLLIISGFVKFRTKGGAESNEESCPAS